jgi:hypothetical protein
MCLHNQGRKPSKKQVTYYLLHDSLLHGLYFDPADGGDMFISNVDWISADYKAF